MRPRRAILALTALLALVPSLAPAQGVPDYEQPPISYSATVPRDAFAALQRRITSGELAFAGSEQRILQSVLDALNVPVWSQVLVFSRTSLQRGRIRPERPRALYFSDSVYVGWVPGGLIEIAAVDPELGPVFYSVDLRSLREGRAKIERDADCMRCHGGTFVRDIPGLFARSVFPDATGEPLGRHGTVTVDDETPFGERWGGWYVTGYHGSETHRGNVIASERGDQLVFTPDTRRPDELSPYFPTSDYLRATSDAVALLVFEHQMAMQNSLTRASQAARKMIAYQKGLQTAFKEPLSDEPVYDSVKSVFTSTVQDVLDHLLFRQAAPLPDGLVGHPELRQSFANDAPRATSGHSLKDLLLKERLFAQRCSYLIYSDSFRQLPETLKQRILDRLREVLQSREPEARYAYLPSEERQRIYEILRETHPDAHARWAGNAPTSAISSE